MHSIQEHLKDFRIATELRVHPYPEWTFDLLIQDLLFVDVECVSKSQSGLCMALLFGVSPGRFLRNFRRTELTRFGKVGPEKYWVTRTEMALDIPGSVSWFVACLGICRAIHVLEIQAYTGTGTVFSCLIFSS